MRSKVVRVQVKSRYQTDGNRSVFLKAASFSAFDFLVIALLNIGYYYGKHDDPAEGLQEVEFITLPRRVARRWYRRFASGMNRVPTKNCMIDKYLDEEGFELIAEALGVDYPNP